MQRLCQFEETDRIHLTRAATFVEKVQLFPGSCFVVGVDTITRVAEPRYYDGDLLQRDRSIDEIANSGCSFLVFGRLLGGRFQCLEQLELPHRLREICRGVEEAAFRNDISSTDLRRKDGD